MKDNKDVLNEAFFKKSSYSEKVQRKMPSYEPIKADSSSVFGTQSAFAVTDTDEMKKRLAGTFGAAFGNNNIKAAAGKAIKSFPILVSDNVEPETVVALKRLMEEQYADYISLLVSNKVIDLSAYDTATDDGSTIAIQALDSISGTDFSKNRVANKTLNTGKISMDDIGANVPLYNLLRENHIENLKTGDSLYDELLENALVVPSENVNDVVKFIRENADSILNEVVVEKETARRGTGADIVPVERGENNQPDYIEDKKGYEKFLASTNKNAVNVDKGTETLADAIKRTSEKYSNAEQRVKGYDSLLKAYSGEKGYADGKQVFDRLSNAEIVVDKGQFDTAMNRTVGELLMDPKNAAIKDRFEKASILLQAEMITGSEYIDYCTMRLGIPISATARATISTRFRRAKALNRVGDYKNNIFMTDADAKRIKQNQKVFGKVAPKIFATKIGAIVSGVAAVSTGAGAVAAFLLGSPIVLGALAATAVGSGIFFIYNLIKKSKMGTKNANKVEGWERVEMLIEAMDKQRAEVISKFSGTSAQDQTPKFMKDVVFDKSAIKAGEASIKNYQGTLSYIDKVESGELPSFEKDEKKEEQDSRLLTGKEIDALQNEIFKQMKKSVTLAESIEYNEPLNISIDLERLNEAAKTILEVYDECMQDPDFRNEQLAESLFRKKETSMPMKVRYIEKKPNKDVLITPEFSARSLYAYGSTEIDSRVAKDRKYNQPLIMTIKFKQRFDDGKFSDNELTAVIGILGVVVRIPSEEMKYILTENTKDNTIKGIFKSDDLKNAVSDLLSTSKINDEVRNLPQSADVWKNLEKVASLAIANKYSGKKTGNVANAHIVFSGKEIDDVRIETGVDYRRDMKLVGQLLKRYSAFTLMIADDPSQRLYIYNDEDDISWNVVPYNAILGKDTGDQLTSALARLARN